MSVHENNPKANLINTMDLIRLHEINSSISHIVVSAMESYLTVVIFCIFFYRPVAHQPPEYPIRVSHHPNTATTKPTVKTALKKKNLAAIA